MVPVPLGGGHQGCRRSSRLSGALGLQEVQPLLRDSASPPCHWGWGRALALPASGDSVSFWAP